MTRPILKLNERVFDAQTHGERFEARMARLADGEHPIRAGESSPRPPAAWRPRTSSSTTATIC